MVEKKKFFSIELPKIEQKAELLASNEQDLIGRTVKIDLTRKLRGKSAELVYKIILEDGKLKADFYRLSILGYFIRRIMRKSVNYVEDSFSATCKDAVLRIKPFIITRKKVFRSVRKALREKAKKEIEESIRNLSYEEIFSELISGKFQRALGLKLKKIYPPAFCDIRDIYVEKKQETKVKEEKIVAWLKSILKIKKAKDF